MSKRNDFGCSLLHHRALRADNQPLTIALHEHVGPNPFPAGVFSISGALFGVTALDHGDVSQHLYLHGTTPPSIATSGRPVSSRGSESPQKYPYGRNLRWPLITRNSG